MPDRRRCACARTRSRPRRGPRSPSGRARSTTAASPPWVIPAVAGTTEMQLDQRHLDRDELAAMFAEAREACRSAAQEFNCTVEERDVGRATPTPFDPALVELVQMIV